MINQGHYACFLVNYHDYCLKPMNVIVAKRIIQHAKDIGFPDKADADQHKAWNLLIDGEDGIGGIDNPNHAFLSHLFPSFDTNYREKTSCNTK